MRSIPLRWVAIGVFVLSSTLNYLDRQLLAAAAPSLMAEFHLSNLEYGQVVSVFSLVYALSAPLAGLFIDRVGLNLGASIAMLVWSAAGAATALTRSFQGLLASRTVLGVAEAAGIPGAGKANATYLQPRELALGTAFNQVGISLGLTAAPLMVAALAPQYGWRSPFLISGILGLVWIPLWWITSRRIPARTPAKTAPAASISGLLRDRRFWGLIAGTLFIMSTYTLWTNWTTLYFVEQWKLPQNEANVRFTWIPPIFALAGGFAGGGLAFDFMRKGVDALSARLRVSWIAAGATLLATACIPLARQPMHATILIGLSFFWTLTISTNLYALPIDYFGEGRAAFGVSALTFAYGMMQVALSPLIGSVLDRTGFTMVCLAMAPLPLIGVAILRFTSSK